MRLAGLQFLVAKMDGVAVAHDCVSGDGAFGRAGVCGWGTVWWLGISSISIYTQEAKQDSGGDDELA